MWEEEFAIIVGSEGAYRAGDVREMTPEKRTWTLRRIHRMREAKKSNNPVAVK